MKRSDEVVGAWELPDEFLQKWCELYVTCVRRNPDKLTAALNGPVARVDEDAKTPSAIKKIHRIHQFTDEDCINEAAALVSRISNASKPSPSFAHDLIHSLALLKQMEGRASKWLGKHTFESAAEGSVR